MELLWKAGPPRRKTLTSLTTFISQRRRWESRAAVIARRVRGRFSVTRLLSRSVRFYFALSRGSAPPPAPNHQHPPVCPPLFQCILLFYSPLIHPSCRLSRLGRSAYFSPSVLSPLRLPPPFAVSSPPSFPSIYRARSLSRVTTSRPYLSPSRPFFPSLAPSRSRTLDSSVLLSFILSLSRTRTPSPTDHP